MGDPDLRHDSSEIALRITSRERCRLVSVLARVLQPVCSAGVLPVVTIPDARDAVPIAQALLRGGLRAIEVALRSDAALRSIASIARELPEMLVGAGTVMSAADLKQAEDSGAQFALSPGSTPQLLAAARNCRMPFIPGIATPSELLAALDAGFELVKFFPAESSGGVRTLTSLNGPFPAARFCPTGGIAPVNAGSYLALPFVSFVGGSWVAGPSHIAARNWAAIEQSARACLTLRSAAQRPPAPVAARSDV